MSETVEKPAAAAGTDGEPPVNVEFTPPANAALQMIDEPALEGTDRNPLGDMTGGEKRSASTLHEMFSLPQDVFGDMPSEFVNVDTPEETPAAGETPTDTPPAADTPPADTPPATAALPKEFTEIFPEAKSHEDVVREVGNIRTELEEYKRSNDEVVEVLSKHPALTRILKDVKKGVALYDSIRQHLDIKEEVIPDPAVDPEAYREYAKKQIERENALRQEEEATKEREKKVADARAHGEAMRTSFVEANKVSEEDMTKFGEFLHRMTYGDPVTFKLPDNYLEIMYKAFRYEADVAAAEKRGTVQGRNEAIESKILHKKIGDGIPALQSVSPKPKVIDQYTELEESLTRVSGDPVTAMLQKA